MATQSRHQEQTEPLSAKSRSITRNSRAFAVALGILLLLAALNLYVFLIPRQGTRIAGTIDGKIDKKYYHQLFSERRKIDDISEIADILAEVNYLTHGEGIEQFRFTIYDENTKPLRVQAFELIARNFRRLKKNESFSVAGLNWGNGDIYIPKGSGAISFLKSAFHELGHGHPRSRLDPLLSPLNWITAKLNGNLAEIECPARLNEIDSIVALMYLDPQLGALMYLDPDAGYLLLKYYKHAFTDYHNEYAISRNYSLYRCLEAGRVEEYPGLEALQEVIKRKTAGKTADQITEEINQGVLEMFKDRFGNREDFKEKYSLLQKYFQDGAVDNSHD